MDYTVVSMSDPAYDGKRFVATFENGESIEVSVANDESEIRELVAFYLDQPAAPLQPIVPTISKAQALLYLLSIGKTDADVKAAIATITDPTAHAVAEIEWNYRQPFHHDHPLFIALGPLLGITDMVAAFRIAATL